MGLPPSMQRRRSSNPFAAKAPVLKPQLSKPPPLAWVTSSGLATDTLVENFIRAVLVRKGTVLDQADATANAKALREKHAQTLATVKVLVINDGNFHKPSADCRTGRANRVTFFWDLELVDRCGLVAQNITKICLFNKPWLFNLPADVGKWDVPLVKSHASVVVDAVRAHQPVAPKPGKSVADELARLSLKLDQAHSAALTSWCSRTFEEYDIVAGQGGDVVLLNLALQTNQKFTAHMVKAVHAGKVIFASMSASTMVCSKSMEMTGEILPGSLENFSVDKKYLVIEKNKIAEAEFELEMGIEVDDELVRHSSDGLAFALQLLNVISANQKYQDNPVYLALRDAEAIQCEFYGEKEVFTVVPNAPPEKRPWWQCLFPA
ncbi:hypothetical protein T492DRAFT_1114314 [Pavlovales sp. CCMP2436]|nr:hypothetical protein T492DRAFT_1114314 [Pavlovales sp. CCMP2436]